MSIQKKSLISTLKTTKKANVIKEDFAEPGSANSGVKSPAHIAKGRMTAGKAQLARATAGKAQLARATAGKAQLARATAGKAQLAKVSAGKANLARPTLARVK